MVSASIRVSGILCVSHCNMQVASACVVCVVCECVSLLTSLQTSGTELPVTFDSDPPKPIVPRTDKFTLLDVDPVRIHSL